VHNPVRFILAGEVQEVRNCDPTMTVLEYLRGEKAMKGTKDGCAEGDCGACTVVIGELHGNGIRYRAVNSCIRFLPSLDGKQLVTVEELGSFDNQLHAVQQAMVDQHGSQCGFCTPGFVMSLFAMFHNEPKSQVTRSDIELGLAGNLCRCTGYAPIVRAAEQALTSQRRDSFSDCEDRQIKQLKAIQPTSTLEISCGDRHFYAPRTMGELCTLLQDHPGATMVAGATDVGLWVTKQMRKLDDIIYLGSVDELQKTEDDGNYVHIGAAVSYSDATQAIANRYPAFQSLIERIGATQVRNAGTVGGNIANGSPIGDMPPGLIATGARLALRSAQGRRVIDLEDYYICYGKQDLRAGECIEKILLPVPPEDQFFATYKICKRFEQDISAVCAAFSLQIENGEVRNARVCYGGMAGIPKRAANCERALNGRQWNQQTINQGMQAMLEDFTPLTDMRASAQYRMKVAQNLLQRFFLEHRATSYPVRLALRFNQTPLDKDVADA